MDKKELRNYIRKFKRAMTVEEIEAKRIFGFVQASFLPRKDIHPSSDNG